jgi:hypothetical protein
MADKNDVNGEVAKTKLKAETLLWYAGIADIPKIEGRRFKTLEEAASAASDYPANGEHSPVMIDDDYSKEYGFPIYARNFKMPDKKDRHDRFGYGCWNCKDFGGGKPKMKISGDCLDYFCRACDANLRNPVSVVIS